MRHFLKVAALMLLFFVSGIVSGQTEYLFLDPSQETDKRVEDLLSRLTFNEKASLMLYNSPAIDRLNIPSYNWWSECLHGVARNGKATVFPQAIGLAATFDTALVKEVASAISDEARAKHQETLQRGIRDRYTGLSFWTPNINIFRDPRWGRGQETYGEDPFLTGLIGAAFVQGLQGDDPHYLKTAACAKHFAVHSGPEPDRHQFNAIVSEKDLRETYLPAFKTLVDAGVEAVMCAYNRLNDEPCCGSKNLLTNILRYEWGFKGHVVSDCWALDDIWARHKVVNTREEAAAMSLKAGVNLNCGYIYKHLPEALSKGLITEKEVDEQLRYLLRTRFRLGLFDPDSLVPWTKIPASVINSGEHKLLAEKAAAASIVLLKNKNHILPLSKDLKSLFITGPTAAEVSVLLGNYNGISGELVTPLEGIIQKISSFSRVEYCKGTELTTPVYGGLYNAADFDVTIAVMGYSPLIEGEEGDALLTESGGDRAQISLPDNQIEFLKKLRGEHQKPIILVVTGGSPVTLTEVEDLVDAVLFVWYPGEQGGNAIADVIFGDHNPSGRLPVTVYRSKDDLPLFYDYSMKNRTYRYFEGNPEFSFGFGLSYTGFTYEEADAMPSQIRAGEKINLSFAITNTGKVAGEETAQVYVTNTERGEGDPLKSLKAIKKVFLEPGQKKNISITLDPSCLQSWNTTKSDWEVLPGPWKIMIGSSSEDIRIEKKVMIE